HGHQQRGRLGKERPPEDSQDREPHAPEGHGRARDREGGLAQPGLVLRQERTAGPPRAGHAGVAGPALRGQLDPARTARLMRLAGGAHLGYCTNAHAAETGAEVVDTLRRVAAGARELRARADRGGRRIRVCLEAEPGCALELTSQVVRFFEGPLARAAGAERELIDAHLGACYDLCHQAVAFEDPADVIAAMARAGIRIGKVQVSSALELRNPADEAARARLAAFDEPRYLHQARARDGGYVDDLPEAFDRLPRDRPWRVHFHSPIDRDFEGPL